MSGPIARYGGDDLPYHMANLPQPEGFERVIMLASNEGAFGPSPKAVAAIRAMLDDLHRYPEVVLGDFMQALAEHSGRELSRLVVGPGSDELLTRLVHAYAGPGDELVHSAHCYGKFPIYARMAGAAPVAAPDRDFRVDVDAVLSCLTERTRIVLLANPDNPTGAWISGAELRRLHAGLPDHTVLAIDGAYTDYVSDPDYEDGMALAASANNVVVLRTFSKIYGLAGLRLGWLFGPPEVVAVLGRLGLTFPLSNAAVAGGIAALEDSEFTGRARQHNLTWRARFSGQLEDLGLFVYPSQTNFVLTRFPDSGARSAEAANRFLLSRGIIARRFNQPDYEDCLRISIGQDFEMQATNAALGEFLAD
jgi:histidinol-phosphate aminotransferase